MSKINMNQNINQLLKKVELKQTKNSKAFVDYSQTIDDTYENLED